MAKATRDEYRQRTAQRVAAAQEVLAGELAGLVSGEDWRRFLEFQSRLHDYSPNNVMLIAAQHAKAFAEGRVDSPSPGYVAGFRAWQALGRQVQRGQHGYAVLAPMRGVHREAAGVDRARRVLRGDETAGPDETEARTPVLRGFKVEHVFEASMTAGAALPERPNPRLVQGEAPPGLGVAVMGLIEARGFAVDTVADAGALGGANGETRWDTRTVVVRADMDDAAMVKTLIHEAAHVLAHGGPPGRYLPRPLKEVEAESVAFVVASVHGMAADGYSFPYVAAWAGGDTQAAIRATQGRVTATARAIIDASPAEQINGGRVPGIDLAVTADRRPDLQPRCAPAIEVFTPGSDGPEVA